MPALLKLRMSPAQGQVVCFHLEVAVGGQILLTAQVEGHQIALALDPGEVVGAEEAHWHSTAPGYLHVWGDPGVINRQDLHESAQAHPLGRAWLPSGSGHAHKALTVTGRLFEMDACSN